MVWWRDVGKTTQVLIGHEIGDAIPYEDNPVRRVREGRETLRRRLDLPDDQLDFEVLFELRERGGTDYLALPIAGVRAKRLSGRQNRAQGPCRPDPPRDRRRADRRSVVVGPSWLHRALGPGARQSDDRDPQRLFDAQAIAIRDHGGEILKFIGDGILAVFPIADLATISGVARDAVAAAHAALAAVRRLADEPAMADEPPLEIVVALHVGTVNYGNIGAADRLDFTVIGRRSIWSAGSREWRKPSIGRFSSAATSRGRSATG